MVRQALKRWWREVAGEAWWRWQRATPMRRWVVRHASNWMKRLLGTEKGGEYR